VAQNETQSPSVLRRSSRSQSEALPTTTTVATGREGHPLSDGGIPPTPWELGTLNVGSMKTKSIWIPVSAILLISVIVFAAGLKASTPGKSATYVGYFLLAEAAPFAVALVLAALIGRPPVLALGVTLGFGVAVASAILLGEDCSDEVFCFGPTPGEAFVLGLVASAVLSPGWALGAGVGELNRLGRRRDEQPNR
jgi:hypothetical protein